MSVCLYRLYAVQNFDGEQVAVYVNEGNWPDQDILIDAEAIASEFRTRGEVFRLKPYFYEGVHNEVNRKKLTYWTRLLKRAKEIVISHNNVDKAIFVESTNKKDWRGTQPIYYNKVFEEIKSDTPMYSACEVYGEITL